MSSSSPAPSTTMTTSSSAASSTSDEVDYESWSIVLGVLLGVVLIFVAVLKIIEQFRKVTFGGSVYMKTSTTAPAVQQNRERNQNQSTNTQQATTNV